MNFVENLNIGDDIEIAGMVCRVRGLAQNHNKGIVLTLKNKAIKVPRKWGKKRRKALRKSRMTLIVPRKTAMTVLNK